MKTIEEMVGALNQLLAAEVLNTELLEQSVDRVYELSELKTEVNGTAPGDENKPLYAGIVLMDFNVHSEQKKEEARLMKLENIKQQNFELAANLRDVEKDCATYLEFSKHYGLEKSAFVIVEGFLIYAYFGDAMNDAPLREFLEKGNYLKNMKVSYDIYEKDDKVLKKVNRMN